MSPRSYVNRFCISKKSIHEFSVDEHKLLFLRASVFTVGFALSETDTCCVTSSIRYC